MPQLHICYTHAKTLQGLKDCSLPVSGQSSGVHNSRGRHPQCQEHLLMQRGGVVSDLISHLLPYFFKTSSSFLCKPFHLVFSSPGMSTPDPHRGDPSYQSYHAFAGRPSLTLQYKVNFPVTSISLCPWWL